MIHCDEVFDILTRGPFPTGAASDCIVESHLAQCDDCRRLAEALRPAIELLQEAITPDEGRDLPRYWGNLAEPQTAGAAKATATKTRRQRRFGHRPAASPAVLPARTASWNGAARLAAAVLLGLVLAGLLRQSTQSHHDVMNQMAGRGQSAHWRLSDDGDRWFAEQALPAACRHPVSGLTLVAALDPMAETIGPPTEQRSADGPDSGHSRTADSRSSATARLACCLGCHSAKDRKLLAATAVGRLVQACGACHE